MAKPHSGCWLCPQFSISGKTKFLPTPTPQHWQQILCWDGLSQGGGILQILSVGTARWLTGCAWLYESGSYFALSPTLLTYLLSSELTVKIGDVILLLLSLIIKQQKIKQTNKKTQPLGCGPRSRMGMLQEWASMGRVFKRCSVNCTAHVILESVDRLSGSVGLWESLCVHREGPEDSPTRCMVLQAKQEQFTVVLLFACLEAGILATSPIWS